MGRGGQYARELTAANKGYEYIHPFDNPVLWSGHGSLMTEVKASGLKPDRILASVGGGGLVCGIIDGIKQCDWNPIPISSVETQGADSFAKSMYHGGEQIRLDKITSLASSLGSPYICKQLLQYSKEYPFNHHVIKDSQAIKALLNFAEDHHILVEPACSATLALLYDNILSVEKDEIILVVVCGGAAVNYQLVQEWIKKTILTQ